MKLTQVAIQLYTLRDFCKNAADFATTARRLREIGFTAIELGGCGPIPENEIVGIAKGEGLTICSSHENSVTVLAEPEKVIERLQKLGCKLAVYPWPRDVNFGQAAEVENLARRLDEAGARLRSAGITLAYHNHAIEFVPHRGRPALRYLFDATKPEHLAAEIDTYWIQLGGENPVDWCESLPNRLAAVHLKDYRFTTENKPDFAEVGRGTLPFKKIISAAEKSGCEWFIVEQDTTPGNPFDSVRQSFDYIKAQLVS